MRYASGPQKDQTFQAFQNQSVRTFERFIPLFCSTLDIQYATECNKSELEVAATAGNSRQDARIFDNCVQWLLDPQVDVDSTQSLRYGAAPVQRNPSQTCPVCQPSVLHGGHHRMGASSAVRRFRGAPLPTHTPNATSCGCADSVWQRGVIATRFFLYRMSLNNTHFMESLFAGVRHWCGSGI